MIRKWLISLRKKPKHARERVAMTAAATVTGLVFVVWLFTMPGQLSKETASDTEKPQAFATFFNQIKEQMAGVKESLPEIETATATDPVSSKPVELSESSTGWTLSSTTIEDKKIDREVPIVVVSQSATTSASSTPALAI